MEQLLGQFDLSTLEDFSIQTYTINIVICTLMLWVLAAVYRRFGRTISNRSQLSRVLIIVGVTTFIIISIVKSSLALSLGLVGALSIVRFRTAIKEPEELGYFFISIALGLGMGANQLPPTLLGFVAILVVIILTNRKTGKRTISQNLVLSLRCKNEDKTKITSVISETISANSNQVDLKRLNYSDNQIDFNFLVNLSSVEDIAKINEELNAIDSNLTITFLDSRI